MQSPQQDYSRINLAELKAQIVRKLGPERSKQYFYYLNRLLSLKLSKVEFEKLCVQVVGRENVPLHNQFIRSILKNACSAKAPPPIPDNEGMETPAEVGEKETSNSNHLQNGYHTSLAPASSSPGLSNGDILPVSPRKARTHLRDRRGGDRRSALGLNENNHSASQELMTTHSRNFIWDNGALTSIDTQSPVQNHSSLSHQSAKDNRVSVHNSGFSIPKRSSDGSVSVHRKDQSVSSAGGDWRQMHARRPLQAPFGVSFCPVSVGGVPRTLSAPTSSKCVSASSFGGLLDSVMLREHMEQISVTQGLEGVSIECANLVNNGLDAYLKRIIGSCIGFVGARLEREPLKNGVRFNHHFQMPRSGRPSDIIHKHKRTVPISLQDFRASLELNPQQLGEDWPLLLEKIYQCFLSFMASRTSLLLLRVKGAPVFKNLQKLVIEWNVVFYSYRFCEQTIKTSYIYEEISSFWKHHIAQFIPYTHTGNLLRAKIVIDLY
ncbi:hypothetical protein Leryth_006050 [Lithospermum erythrorhizon]|nr:hypothetical protein Leryth_006050 [Lithospermum erythrorhizon]